MRILSLFDGMACGMIAMQTAGVEAESYDAYEIDEYAIKAANHNFPNIYQHGDVFNADFANYAGNVDFLIGGSPCTYWSIAQSKNRETEASGIGWELFSQYVRALQEAKPKFFIYENNKSMSKAIRESIDKAFGFEAICINSALVSAQNRQRLYWVGKRNEDGTYSKVDISQPNDRKIALRDIVENTMGAEGAEPLTTCDGKAYALTTKCANATPKDTIKRHRHTMIAERVCANAANSVRKPIYEVQHGMITINQEKYPVDLRDGFYNIRKLTVRECMKLQTVPEWYDFSVISNTRAYICLGNGWTIEVIAHLIRNCLKTEVE